MIAYALYSIYICLSSSLTKSSILNIVNQVSSSYFIVFAFHCLHHRTQHHTQKKTNEWNGCDTLSKRFFFSVAIYITIKYMIHCSSRLFSIKTLNFLVLLQIYCIFCSLKSVISVTMSLITFFFRFVSKWIMRKKKVFK